MALRKLKQAKMRSEWPSQTWHASFNGVSDSDCGNSAFSVLLC
jgi:hypothetical protein